MAEEEKGTEGGERDMKEIREEKAKVRNIKKRGDAGLMKRHTEQTDIWRGIWRWIKGTP